MPFREPKSRYLVREYMADREFMMAFTADEREAYLLLSLYADDAGWLDWDVAELAANIYRYQPVDARESNLSAYAEHFKSTGRLKVYRCGHAVMPRVANRPRGMAREHRVQDAHSLHSKSTITALASLPDHTKPNRTPSIRARDRASGGPGALEAPTRRNGNGTESLKDIVGQFEDIIKPGAPKS